MYADPRDLGELTERLGLGSFARTTVRRLSGGQRQRLALAAAIVGRPEVVFLDEPSAGMDPQSRHAVWDLVRELRDEGVAVRAHHAPHGRGRGPGRPRRRRRPRPRDRAGLGAVARRVRRRPLAAARDRRPGSTSARGARPGLRRHRAARRLLHRDRAPSTRDASPTLTAWLADRGVLVTRLSVGRRTLEDVFLDLTGRNLR